MKNLLLNLFVYGVFMPILALWHVLTWMVKVTQDPHFNEDEEEDEE